MDSRCDLPDGVAGAQADPLGDGTVLALSLGKLLLGAEGLVALLKKWWVRYLVRHRRFFFHFDSLVLNIMATG